VTALTGSGSNCYYFTHFQTYPTLNMVAVQLTTLTVNFASFCYNLEVIIFYINAGSYFTSQFH